MIDKAKGKPRYESGSHQDVLMKAIGFTYDDLDANRDGYMSKKQRGALSQERQSLLNRVAIVVGGTAILCAIILLGNMIEGGAISYGLVGIVLIFFAPVLISLVMWLKRSQINADLHKGTVYATEGLISLDITQYGPRTIYYYMYIQEQKFQLEKPVFDAFIDGDPYAIYYSPHSKTLLSAEWLREG